MTREAVECSGCLICGTARRPLTCPDCINASLAEKRRLRTAAANASEALRDRLSTALSAKDKNTSQQQEQQLQGAQRARCDAANRVAAADAQLQQVRRTIRQLEERNQARRQAIHAAEKQLADVRRKRDMLADDGIRSRQLALQIKVEQLVIMQRKKLLVLQEILPLTLSPVRNSVPSSAGGTRLSSRPHTAASAASSRALVSIAGLRLPEGVARVGCDAGQEAQELGSALGYLLLFLHVAATYLGGPLLHQAEFMGSWSSMWQPSSFWRSEPASPAAVHRLSFAPQAFCEAGAATAGSAMRLPSQPASHPMEAVSALAQRSGRYLWGGVAAGLHAYAAMGSRGGGGAGGASGGHDPAAGVTPGPSLAAKPGEDELRQAQMALGMALHALHRSAGAVVADQLGPNRAHLPPEWGAFAALAALVACALRPMLQADAASVRQRAAAAAGPAAPLYAAGAASSVLGRPLGAPASLMGTLAAAGDSRIAGVSTLFAPDADAAAAAEGWALIARPGATWGGAAGLMGGLPLLPPPPSQPEAVEHWTRALILDAHAARQGGEGPPAAAWRALGALQQGVGALRQQLGPHLAAVAARLPHVAHPRRSLPTGGGSSDM